MKTKLLIGLGLLLIIIVGVSLFEKSDTEHEMIADSEMVDMDHLPVRVMPISHATMLLGLADITIYNDPVGDVTAYADKPGPNIILLSDVHGDHLNVETLEAVAVSGTVIVAPQAVADELTPALLENTKILANDETITVLGINITGVPMYNLPESDEAPHTKGRGNGYLLEQGDIRIYIAGDTADIPEMRALTDIDMAFVPMNLPYTMTVEQAADGVLAFAPAHVYPYHYRGPDGLSDVAKFKELVEAGNKDIEVIQLDWYPEVETVATESTDADKVFTIDSFSFGYSLEEITVSKGDTVTINLTNSGGFHDLVIDEFGVATEKIAAGNTTSVTFVADETGTFEYYCSVGSHRAQGMVGKLIVE